MAREVNLRISLTIKKGLLDERITYSFIGDMAGEKGPSPGVLTIGVGVTIINLSQLATPGPITIINLDTTNFVEWGLYSAADGEFNPVGEILPGEPAGFRLSRYLGTALIPGTGTTPIADTKVFAMKAVGAPCDVIIKAFEK